jgi:hypothetical protein
LALGKHNGAIWLFDDFGLFKTNNIAVEKSTLNIDRRTFGRYWLLHRSYLWRMPINRCAAYQALAPRQRAQVSVPVFANHLAARQVVAQKVAVTLPTIFVVAIIHTGSPAALARFFVFLPFAMH